MYRNFKVLQIKDDALVVEYATYVTEEIPHPLDDNGDKMQGEQLLIEMNEIITQKMDTSQAIPISEIDFEAENKLGFPSQNM